MQTSAPNNLPIINYCSLSPARCCCCDLWWCEQIQSYQPININQMATTESNGARNIKVIVGFCYYIYDICIFILIFGEFVDHWICISLGDKLGLWDDASGHRCDKVVQHNRQPVIRFVCVIVHLNLKRHAYKLMYVLLLSKRVSVKKNNLLVLFVFRSGQWTVGADSVA